jgi:hypothetical protein
MLESIKRWFSGMSSRAESEAVHEWAEAKGHDFKRPRESEGFIIEAARNSPPWRVEWGPSQRTYIAGPELRIRAETGAAADVHMLLISRGLMELLERQVFEQFTEQLQTRIDSATPEEMRWLVLYPKAPASDLKGLRDRFGGVASAPVLLPQWLQGPLADKLSGASGTWLSEDDALVLMVQRGRLTLRMSMATPDVPRLTSAIGLFEVALREARRVAEYWRTEAAHGAQTTQPSLWGREGPPTQN